MNKNYLTIILFIFISIFFTLSFLSAKNESLTYDEIIHLQEGLNALRYHTFKIDTNNPPLIRELASLPLFLGLDNLIRSNSPIDKILPARLVIIFLSILLGFSIFFVAKFYFGIKPAIFSLFLFIFEPNILGNNHYLTLDIGLTLFFFGSYVFLLKFIEKKSIRNFVIHSLLLGLAMSSKISTLFYFIAIAPAIVIIKFKEKSFSWVWERKYYIFFSLLLAIFALWATYFLTFDVLVAKREDPNRVSSKLLANAKAKDNKILESVIYFSQNQKLPLGNYLAAIKNSIVRNNKQNNEVYFLGKSYSSSKWYFMLINFILKTPVPLLIFSFIPLFLFIKNKHNKEKYLYFFVPFIAILLMSSFSNMNPLIRYILPLYPFLIIISSTSINFFNKGYFRLIFMILCLWYIYGTFSYFPHFISYANELSGTRDKRYEIFIDSNIDWGQSLYDFKKYIENQQPNKIMFSYFGRDNGELYGLKSDFPYGSHKFEDICKFHKISKQNWKRNDITAISISNWYYCGYSKKQIYSKEKVVNVVGDSILIFK